jgi:predicted lipid-binding transport protein (Tim44 family)
MISLGVLLVILGVGSLVLPSLNLQFQLMEIVDPYQPWAGIIVAAVGLITILFGAQRRGRKEVVVESTAQAAPAPPAAPASTTAPPASTTSSTASAMDRAGEPTTPVGTTPPAERPAWPTDPPERHDD